MQPALTFNSLQYNPLPNYTTSRHLSRPPLQTVTTNPLSYSLINTNSNNTQPTKTNNNQLNTRNPSSTSQQSNTSRNILQNTQFQIPNPPSTTIRTNPYIRATYSQPVTNPPNISSNVSNIPTYNTNSPSTISQPPISQPTYINASTSISEPIKPFDGLDNNYTPGEYLQHIEARVTFSLGLQLTSDHEYKFWHARRMALIQFSLLVQLLAGTSVQMTPINKIGTPLYKLSKNISHHRKTLTVLKLKPSTLLKRVTKQYVILHLEFNS